MLDAPVSGGSEGAAKGTLSIMVGGDEADFNRALPVFQAMGKNIVLVGAQGAGQTVKLVNQILVVGNALAMSEALLFAQAGGVDVTKALAAVSGGAAGSWMLSNRGPQILNRDWRPGFTIDLQQKDLRLVASPLKLSATPVRQDFAPPQLGEHTRVLLQELLGYSPEKISALAQKGVL